MQKKRWLGTVLIMTMLAIMLAGCQMPEHKQPVTAEIADASFQIHVIDVDQGDSILIQSENQTLLIDAGENNMGERVVSYIQSLGITSLDYVIGTHPHSDHIGGLDLVIDSFDVGKVILPAVNHTSKTFEDVLIAIKKQGKKITKPVVGEKYNLGDATFQIIAPNSKTYDDLNDYSVGVRVEYGKTHYVFAADADSVSEQEMSSKGIDISADVLKLNHHGSRYSNSSEFLDAVNPAYAVISVGKENSYGHPHEEVLAEMKRRNISVYRTDESGTIIITSDGTQIGFTAKPSQNLSTAANEMKKEELVYITKSGTKYHEAGCSYLKSDAVEVDKEEAEEEGYSACSRCLK